MSQPKYKTFIRSCTTWSSFARARKKTVDRNLTYDEARRACQNWNASRTEKQNKTGTMMEFTAQ